jgi:7-keto-8-aminopelargonate synthetase-like enzyme
VSDGCVLGTQELVAHLRRSAHGSVYAETMAPPVCQQILTSLRIIMGEDGTADGMWQWQSHTVTGSNGRVHPHRPPSD